MIEGYLRKWVGIMYGWKLRYFILHNGLLSFCDKKGGKRLGIISLRIATISTTPEDSLRLIIHTGTHEVHVRADNLQDMKKWQQAFAEAQEEALNRDYVVDYDDKEVERLTSPQVKVLKKETNLNPLKEKLAEVWCCQAEFDEQMSLLAPKIKNIPHLKEQSEQLERLGNNLKYKVTECVTKLEEERKKVLNIAYKFDTAKTYAEDGIRKKLDFDPRGLDNGCGYEDENGTVFQSFDEDEDDDDNEGRNSPSLEIYKPPSRQPSFLHTGVSPVLNLGDLSSRMILLHPLIKKIITENPVFVETRPIPKENRRDRMPYWIDPNHKFNIWSIVKDMVGKDLSKFAVPVWLNEPLSMLQKLCEQLEYSRLLDVGAQKEDSALRMAYVMGFSLSYYAGTVGRHKKPFNPILGETFEYVPVDGSFRFVSEQVSHHPPISAGFADGNNFQWWGDTQIKTMFKGTSLEAKSLGWCHAVLKPYDDHIIYKRPITGVQNLILGTMYIENYGEAPFQNIKTGDTGQLMLKKRGWGDKGAYETEGWIKDKNGTLKYTLQGKWNSYLTAIHAITKQEIKIWERYPIPENYEQQYCFSNYTKQLNYLYEDLVSKLPATDCRLRPDQRALEYGFLDLARDEKHRLEEKQRARRKELQAKGETHKAKWFREVKDPATDEKSYSYIGGYWECRERSNFGDVLDLF